MAAGSSSPTAPLSAASTGAPSAREQQLIAQMQLMQQRIDQLEQQASQSAASSSVKRAVAAGRPCGQQAQLQLLSPPPGSSKGQQLHRDALHCVFAFLSLSDLSASMRSCHGWCAAVPSLPLQDGSLRVSSGRQLYQLLVSIASPLARHVVSCDVRDMYPVADLAQFLTRLPRLQSLSHQFCRSLERHPQLYPNQLRELAVHLPSDQRRLLHDDLYTQLVNLSSASGLRRLTLTVPIDELLSESFTLESLKCMKQLEFFALRNSYALPPKQLMLVRRLTSLRTLSLDCLSEQDMLILLKHLPDCPPLQLRAFEGKHWLDAETARLLVRMPTLQHLEPYSIKPAALKLVAHGLPDLRTLRIDAQHRWVDETGVYESYDWRLVCESLAACRHLTSLTLMATPLEELAALLLALPPSVRKLVIFHCSDFLHSDVFFTCVAEGGLRQLQQLEVLLDWSNDGEGNSAHMAAWLTRQRACVPRIQVALSEWRESEEDSAP
jgi:hypothetical protein